MSNYGPNMTVFPGQSISPDVLAQIQQAVAPTQQQGVLPSQPQGGGITNMNPYSAYDAQASQAQMAAINAAGPDVYDKAITSVRDDRRSMLDAIASAGSAGKAEYQRQAEQASASKSAALASAVAAAQSHNADPSTLAALQNTISRPYEEGASARDAASANWQSLYGAIGAANDAYMAKYADILPVMQAQARSDLASKFAITRTQAQRDIETNRQSSQVQLAQLSLQQAQNEAAIKQHNDDLARQQAQTLAEWGRQDEQQRLDNDFRQKQFDENVREYGLDYALKQEQLAKSGSGQGGSGIGNTGMTATQFKAAVPSAIAGLRQGIDPNNIFGSTLGKVVGLDKAVNQLAGHNIGLQNNVSDALMAGYMPKYGGTGLNFGPTVKTPAAVTWSGGFGSKPQIRPAGQLAAPGVDQVRASPIYNSLRPSLAGAIMGDPTQLANIGLRGVAKPSETQLRTAIMQTSAYQQNRDVVEQLMQDYGI